MILLTHCMSGSHQYSSTNAAFLIQLSRLLRVTLKNLMNKISACFTRFIMGTTCNAPCWIGYIMATKLLKQDIKITSTNSSDFQDIRKGAIPLKTILESDQTRALTHSR